jgi:hypothetical protein
LSKNCPKYCNKDIKKREFPYRNGARGILIHSFLKLLFQSDEKYPIEPIFDDPPIYEDDHPFCSYCRLLLTIIYNLTCGIAKPLDKNLENLNRIMTNDFPLDDLIKRLRILSDNSQESLISVEKVFSWLSHFYTIGNETITHLINISGKSSRKNKKISFEKEINIAKETPSIELHETDLNDIHLRINPSGVVYLRYLIPHFEFFSNYRYWRNDKFIKTFKPLYLATEIVQYPDRYQTVYKYEFEILLDDVFNLVKRKKHQNDGFLKERVFKKSNISNLQKYLKSDFVVHFSETSDLLYSTRLITTHLTYIDQFRRFVTENYVLSDKKIWDNKKKYGTKSKVEIQTFILEIQKKYIDLYLSEQGGNTFDSGVYPLMLDWKKHIDNLLEGKGSSFHSLDYQRNLFPEF